MDRNRLMQFELAVMSRPYSETLELTDEIRRLRAWLGAIGGLADVDADNRGWMSEHALKGLKAPVTDEALAANK